MARNCARHTYTRPAQYGFVGVVVSVEDLSASIWVWHEHDGQWAGSQA